MHTVPIQLGGCCGCCCQSEWARIDTSAMTKRTRNPIRGIVETLKPPTDSTKDVIPLSLGTLAYAN